MAANASYTESDPKNPNNRHAAFENYQPLICMLWLAAQDENQHATEGHTIEGRLTHFIAELALLGRAHNWDKTRAKKGTSKDEEYDDLEGDNPSCFSGMNRRLFQSVIAHPLFKKMTQERIKQELRFFIRDYVIDCINKHDKEQLKQAYQSYIETLDLESVAPLKVLSITSTQQEAFMQTLQKNMALS